MLNQLNMKFFLLINVRVPQIDGIYNINEQGKTAF